MHRQVIKKADKGVFETVTGTFKKLSFSGKDEKHSRIHLALMNIPHWLAKRDAAYEGAVFLIKNALVSQSPEKRQYAYTRILALLNLAIKAHKRVLTNLRSKQKKKQVDHIEEYFNLLTNLVKAGSSLLDVDIIMASNKNNSIGAFIGSQGAENLKIISVTCMEDEKKLHESVTNLIITVEQLLEKEENRSKKALEKVDRDRYDEAFAELKNIYKKDVIESKIKKDA
jgi:hypothetical protein